MSDISNSIILKNVEYPTDIVKPLLTLVIAADFIILLNTVQYFRKYELDIIYIELIPSSGEHNVCLNDRFIIATKIW